jgi:hypothetical protein
MRVQYTTLSEIPPRIDGGPDLQTRGLFALKIRTCGSWRRCGSIPAAVRGVRGRAMTGRKTSACSDVPCGQEPTCEVRRGRDEEARTP